ncbi:MAG: RelA/SpoT family protein, partial [Bacteroidota bacterium]
VPLAQEKLSCWQVYELVTSRYKTHPTKFRNWLSYPRPNGYQALHTTVMSKDGEWVEVQIRTKRMNEIAEKGPAAHWKYKEGDKNDQLGGLDTQLAQLRKVLENDPKKVDELLNAL